MSKGRKPSFESRVACMRTDTWEKIDKAANHCHMAWDTWLEYAIAMVEQTRYCENLSFAQFEDSLRQHYLATMPEEVADAGESTSDDLPY